MGSEDQSIAGPTIRVFCVCVFDRLVVVLGLLLWQEVFHGFRNQKKEITERKHFFDCEEDKSRMEQWNGCNAS